MNVPEAYARCEAITAEQARNFSYGIRLLPREKRQAMSALYAMARRIDDVGDGNAPPDQKLSDLAAIRKDLAQISSRDKTASADDPVLVALADAAQRFSLPMSALDELVDGCEMDVNGTTYRTFDDLVVYCRRVAGTVGRLSLGVYGSSDTERAVALADALGVALQITNILRDVVEDLADMGRVYLPEQDRERFGIGPGLEGPRDRLLALILFEAARAEQWYEEGLQLLPLLDRRSRACTAAMAGIYRRLLTTIQHDPEAVLRGRISLGGGQKALIAARALTRGAA
ncbi:MAG TPA: presqualene diphosphate synthase HpnD [Acidimicrobiales bacterium]|nr:presqualene diphosphate synthase HpnD [Acidimicrobiales bacterium]